MIKEVSVLVGAGSIGMAIARRVGAGRITVLADGGCTASYWYGDLQYLKSTH